MAVALIVACVPQWPFADASVSLFAWNRSTDHYVIKVGQNGSQRCFVLDPTAIGKFASFPGSLEPGGEVAVPVRLFRDDEDLGPLQPTTGNALFIVHQGDVIEQVAIKYRSPPPGVVGLVVDLPQYPELDGSPSPLYLPETQHDCVIG